MGDFFKQKKKTPEVEVVADPYKGVREKYTGWLQGQVGKAGPKYPGEMVAGMSPYEQQSLDWLGEYGKPSEIGELRGAEIKKTLAGEYDPTTSPYYQAVKAEAARNLTEAKEGIASEAAGGGRYWAGARLGEQREATTDVTQALNTLLGGMAERERERRLEVLPFAREEEEKPLRKAAAFQTYGALPREIEQARKTAILQDWIRSEYDWPLQIGAQAGQTQQAPMYGQVGYGPSPFETGIGYAKDIASIIGSLQGAPPKETTGAEKDTDKKKKAAQMAAWATGATA